MADFSFLSDTDDSAVEDLISQTQELCVLEQVAAINCSGFTDSALPSDLDSRFRKLKSFPAAKSNSKKLSSSSSSDLKPQFDSKKEQKKSAETERDSDDQSENEIFSPTKQNPHRKRPESASPPLGRTDFAAGGVKVSPLKEPPNGKKVRELKHRRESKPRSISERDSDDESENEIFSPAKQNPPRKRSESASSQLGPSDFAAGGVKVSPLKKTPNGKKVRELKHRPKSKPRSFSSSSSESSISPPRSAGCLWWSPGKSSGKKKKNKKKLQNRKLGSAGLGWCSDEDFLSDLGMFSAKEQQKIMSKAMKAEEKINREAEKIVKWAKQASASMKASNFRHELSDDDDDHTKK